MRDLLDHVLCGHGPAAIHLDTERFYGHLGGSPTRLCGQDDIDVLDEKDEVRRMLGYLPQDFGVYPKVSAYELLDHFAQLKGIASKGRRREVVDGLLQQTNLFEVRHQKLGTFSDHWAPRIVARYNGNEVRIAKVEGEFIWHKHDATDELFLIVDGELDMEFRDRVVTLRPGELIVVPRGTEHRPCARKGKVAMMMIDLEDTPNTGDETTATKAVEI